MKEMILKTKRLLLRELKQDDFDDICKLLQDPINVRLRGSVQ